MTEIIFEHPLTEKMRTWLRLEYLFKSINCSKEIDSESMAINHLRSLIEISEVLERGDIKVDLYKDLDRFQAKFSFWSQAADVDQNVISNWQNKLKSLSEGIKQAGRFNTHLQNDKLLNVVRQRIAIPGGCCNFDLPTFHVWLHLPKYRQQEIINDWFRPLEILYEVIATINDLTRNMGQLKQVVAKKGFFQDVAEDKELLRLHLSTQDLIYPQVSGVKNRFMIRFLPYDAEAGFVPEQLSFTLATC
ncbi:cell division protein ZapD [Thorsellia kenyensis]|uniref:Cell division protein ZapD n=1 Tax=Thorsellia kenyensis TaxID=1549888 RepID=A0ABV6CDZ9_9GAMM